MKTTVIAMAMLLGVAACVAPNAVYCPQGFENPTRCHAGDNHEGPDRSRGESDGPSRGDNEDNGQSEVSGPE